MKFKLIDGSTILLAGVASYETVNKPQKPSSSKDINIKFDFDFPKEINIDTDALKEELNKFKNQAKAKAKEAKAKTKETYQDNRNSNSDTNEDYDFMNGFAETMKGFGKNMESLGKTLEANISTWGETFEKGMENFEKHMDDFGDKMEKWSEEVESNSEGFADNLEKTILQYANNFEKHWSNDYTSNEYSTWQLEALFSEMYLNSKYIQSLDQSPGKFFEVEGYDLCTNLDDQLTFIGCQVSSLEKIPYNFVSHQLEADKWLIVKLTKEEYSKDWMNKLSELEQLDDYDMEQYFIIRHFKDHKKNDEKKIKLYVPLKNTAK